ncbi:MAG: molybdopterin molybdenumtransferase MoeA [Anaerolineae bacterium UTCFX2]|nr:molybdopterin molybdenumtransferase MoeA [Anaerolineae bacterium]MCZ7551679.1 molybdopterin-binding protein [Anaerolineales bacterium]OQY91734.1 MAG: molybdopterin molybdenumtransferase MoeA [Anaerolineae bacterium UTCFX2]
MSEFLELLPPDQALELILSRYKPDAPREEVEAVDALGRVSAAPVCAPYALPSFNRSTVDGFAVRAADTFGASDSLPAYLQLRREVPMGAAADFELMAGECALIHTGGMLPAGADAVVMIEHTQNAPGNVVEIQRAVAPGENMLEAGEDVRQGEEVLPAGKRLRPEDIGGLMALGVTRLIVAASPRVGLISSGDEVIPPGNELQPGQVRDVNSYSLGALVERAGGTPVRSRIAPDRLEALSESAQRAHAECELVVITAGSSVSARDLTAQAIQALGAPGVLVHGVNIKPGKPTILALCGGKPVIGLPGNPVSALVSARLFVLPLIERLLGLAKPAPAPSLIARLSLNLASQAGREDWVPVRLVQEGQAYLAEPVFGKSNLIFTLSRADGLIRIPADANGLNAGESVTVYLL